MGHAIRTDVSHAADNLPTEMVAPAPLGYVCVSSIALAGLVFLLFARTWGFPFVPYDDAINITENPLFAVAGTENFSAIWRAPLHKLYIPLTYSAWAGTARLARQGLSGDGYHVFAANWFHAANVLLHLWNTIWVAALLRRWIRSELAIVLAAAVFAIHPIQCEAVVWVTGMKDLLFTAFALPSIWCFINFARALWRPFLWLAIATLTYALALLAKPSALALPLIILVVGHYERLPLRRVVPIFAGWVCLALPIVIMTFNIQADTVPHPVSLWQRPLIAAHAICFYVLKLLAPFNLALDYGATPSRVIKQGAPVFALIFVLLLAIWLWRRRADGWWFGVGLATAASAPVLGFVPFEFQSHSTVADRYLYLPMFGVSVLLAMLIVRWRRFALWLSPVLLGLTWAGYNQVSIWSNAESLFNHTLQINPGSVLAWQSLGAGRMTEERWMDAVPAFTSALTLRPRFGDALYNLGLAYERLGRDDEALTQFAIVAMSGAPTAASLEGGARTAKRLGRWQDSLSYLQKCEKLFSGRAQTAWLQAETLAAAGDLNAAKSSYVTAIGRQPNAYEIHTSYADFLSDHGAGSSAIEEYRTALRLNPRAIAARVNLAGILAQMGSAGEAEAELRESIRQQPELVTAHVNLGILLEQTGDMRAAAESFKHALTLDPNRRDAASGLARIVGSRS